MSLAIGIASATISRQQAPTFDTFKENLGFLWNGTLYNTAWCFRQLEKVGNNEMYGLVFPTVADRGAIIVSAQQLRGLRDRIKAVSDNDRMIWNDCGMESPWSFYQKPTNLYKLCFPGRDQFGKLLISANELRTLAEVIGRVDHHGLFE